MSSTKENPLVSAWRWLRRDLTIEPAIFVYAISGAIAYGSGTQTQLMIWKVCSVVKGYNDTVCDNLGAEEHDEVQNEVQIYKNNFAIKDQMLSSWPSIIYVFFAGALSDRFGRKWLICLPVLGVLVSTAFQIVHYIFIRDLPMEFFYLDNWFAYTGGYTMFYMGIYAYGSDVSTAENRGRRLARFDGVETVAAFVGTLLSPHIFDAGGYYTLYFIRFSFVAIALVYWMRSVKSPEELGLTTKEEEQEGQKEDASVKAEEAVPSLRKIKEKVVSFLKVFVLSPLKDLWSTISKERPSRLRTFLYINFVVYFLYVTTYAYAGERYLYMRKVFDDFTGRKFANMVAMEQVLSVVGLVFVVPFCLGRLRMHETSLQFVVCVTMAAGLTCAGLSANIFPQFVLSIGLTSVHTWQWSLCRTVFTKMVEKNEVGKIFTVVALLGSTLSLAAVPLYKKLYNATIRTVPAAFLFYSAGAYIVVFALNVILFSFRSRFVFGRSKEEEEEEEEKKEKEHKKTITDTPC